MENKKALDTACRNFAEALRNSNYGTTVRKPIVYHKGATLLVVRRDMISGRIL